MLNKIKTLLWNRKYVFLFIGLFIIVLSQRFLSDKQRGLMNSVSSDGVGYYCYLPAAVIYQDFSYRFYYQDENKINPFYRPGITKYKDSGVNKYYCGTAICLLPFFLVGVLISLIAGTDVNGYTDTFLMLVSIASIIYYLLSVFFISKIAKFFNVPEKISLVGCLIFFFGTNLFHYTIQEPSMSHVYSFFAISFFLYLFTRIIERKDPTNFIILGLAIGLVFLIRPVNVIIILFTPFFFNNFKEYLIFLKSILVCNLKGFFYFVLAVLVSIFIQFLLYYFQTGDFIILSYEGETFNFFKPEFLNVLFSYRKGLMLYVPILFWAFLFILLTNNNWYKKVVFFITFASFLYITSSWWCWWYGGSLSIRPIIDILPTFILFSILLFHKLAAIKRRLVFLVSIPFLFYNQLLAYQYSNLLIETENMDKEKFWDAFLATDYNSILENKKNRILKDKSIIKTELLNYEDTIADSRIVLGGYKSEKACIVGKTNYYSKGFSITKTDLNIDDSFYLLVECMVKVQEEDKRLALVVAATQNEIMTGWYIVLKSQFKTNEDGWIKMANIVEIDKSLFGDSANIKIFANSDKGKSLIDDLRYSVVRK